MEREGDHNDITVGLEGLIASSTLELRSVVKGGLLGGTASTSTS